MLLFLILTALTQVGGFIFLLSALLHQLINEKISSRLLRIASKASAFILLYLLFTFAIIPSIAPWFGRVPLPLTEQNHLKPINKLSCLLNRNYVRPQLRQTAFGIATELNSQNPGFTLCYLDANFPFFNHFPLLPHLSHNDGKKLDLAFCYWNAEHQNTSPSWFGYGVSEEPADGEVNTCAQCSKQGYWQYGLLNKLVSQKHKSELLFDTAITKQIVILFAQDNRIGKIFIEPHLKVRLGLSAYNKIRFQGCHSVRHDDHIHVQLK